MNLFRKILVSSLASFLFLTLLVTALTGSVVNNLGTPDKLKTWLANSSLSDSVANMFSDIGSAAGYSFDKNDPTLKTAAASAFPKELVNQDINIFLDSNYAWFQGKTAKPDFAIDLSVPKQQFANNVGLAVTKHLQTVPACSAQQLTQISHNINPLSVPCLPPGVNPIAAGQQVTTEVATSGFLDNGILTADSKLGGQDKNNDLAPNPSPNNKPKDSEPYYKRLSFIPKVYKKVVMAPLLLSAVAIFLAILMIFTHPSRRKGIRRVASTALLAGLVLISTIVAGNIVARVLEKGIASEGDTIPLVRTLLHPAINSITTVNAYIGAGFIALAIVIYFVLLRTRSGSGGTKQPKAKKTVEENDVDDPASEEPDDEASDPLLAEPEQTALSQTARKRPAMDLYVPPKKPSAPAVPTANDTPKQSVKKRPRLIQ